MVSAAAECCKPADPLEDACSLPCIFGNTLPMVQFLVTLEGIMSPSAVERVTAAVESGGGRVVSVVPSSTLHVLLRREELQNLHTLPGLFPINLAGQNWLLQCLVS